MAVSPDAVHDNSKEVVLRAQRIVVHAVYIM